MIRSLAPAALCLWAGVAHAACAEGDGQVIDRVCFEREEGPIYGHSILGDTPEWNRLVVIYANGQHRATVSPDDSPAAIFEDVAPRLVDVTGDSQHEVMVVESAFDRGARVSLYALTPNLHLLAATPYIGQRNRWYAPIGAADLDGDGAVEIAFVDRPHLAKVLRVFRYVDGALLPVASAAGVTNHRIGEPDIAGGIRNCGDGPQMIVASADWSRLLAVRLAGDDLIAEDIGPHDGRRSFASAMTCD